MPPILIINPPPPVCIIHHLRVDGHITSLRFETLTIPASSVRVPFTSVPTGPGILVFRAIFHKSLFRCMECPSIL